MLRSLATLALVLHSAALLAQAPAPRQHLPVLAFPEPGVDDTAVYQGYQTRFFRDAAGNTVQIYLEGREGRVVHLLANAEDESIAFSARDGAGRPVAVRWASPGVSVSGPPRRRVLEYELVADAPLVNVGWFLLGSMRVERDFQYARRQRAPFASPPFSLPEIDSLTAALERLEPAARARHLGILDAPTVAAVRARLQPVVTTHSAGTTWSARVRQPSLDGRDTLALELLADTRSVEARRAGDSLSLRARSGDRVRFRVRIVTGAPALTPLARREIFSPEFLTFLAAVRSGGGASARRAHWLERQVRGVELLVSREKLMAGLPAYATYFGRDMLVAALMMRDVWRDEMAEFAIAAALRKLSPGGEVSHEEALGGQAVREAAAEYAALLAGRQDAARAGRRADADSLLRRAESVLRDRRRVRENYHMIDDELQLPVLVARWLGDAGVPAARKRRFLLDHAEGGAAPRADSRAVRLLRELALVARMTDAYAREPIATNLIGFPPRDSTWSSASWRDSGAGYAGGRFAMDVNAIWAPHALEAIDAIARSMRAAGLPLDSLVRVMPELAPDTPLGRYLRNPAALREAVGAWWNASRHFVVRLGPAEVRTRVAERLAAMPDGDRAFWARQIAANGADRDSLVFLALALDAGGRPIGVANTDPATRLFLGDGARVAADDPAARAAVLRDVRLFVRPYPAGLLIDRVGPAVANDAYATPPIWREFDRDRYHGPRVVWGREVNLFLLGAASHIAAASGGDPARDAYVRELREAIDRVAGAVEASGFRSELWSYEVTDGRVVAVRYGTGSDVQLWSTTDLAVQFALSRLRR